MSARKRKSPGRDGDRHAEPKKVHSQPDPVSVPISMDVLKAALAQDFIEHLHARYKHTPNPIHALEAYRLSRAVKIDVPAWILELFDQWAEVLCVNPPKGGKAIADALGLSSKGGPSITAQAKKQARNVTIGQRVLFLRDRNPERETLDIFQEVAEEFGLSSERVASIWYELTRDIKP